MHEPGNDQRGKRLRDVGIFTAIPSMLIVGPALGWFLGHLAAQEWGHREMFEACGLFLGLLASARQIWLLLKRHGSGS
jgi:uncharacterized protein YqgC (DUF456 family)